MVFAQSNMSTWRSSRRPLRMPAPGAIVNENDALVARAWHTLQEEREELARLQLIRSTSRAARDSARLALVNGASVPLSSAELDELQQQWLFRALTYKIDKRQVREKRAHIAQLQAAYAVEFQRQFGYPPP